MKKFLITLFLALACCLPSAAIDMNNNNYGTHGTVTYFDNSPYFTTYNLWHTMPAGAPQVSQFAASRTSTNTFVYRALDPSHNVWEYNELWATNGAFTNSWLQHSEMGTDNKVLALGFGKIYKLTNSACTTQNEFTIKKWNNTAWVDPVTGSSCSSQIAVGDVDGTLGSRVLSGHLYVIDAGTSAWVQLTGGASSYQSIALSSKSYVLANDITGKIYQRTAGTNIMAATTLPNTPETNGTLYTSYAGELWFKGSSGKTYIYDGTSAWVHPIGYTFSTMATAGPMNTFATVGTTLYRFTELGMSVDITISGSAQCPPTGCPPTSNHTPSFYAELASGSLGALNVTGASVFPTDTAFAIGTVKSYDTWGCALNNFDPIVCFTPGTNSIVKCSILQQIYQSLINFLNPPPPTQIVLPLFSDTCTTKTSTTATLDAKWGAVKASGVPRCYPKPSPSWEEGTYDGNSCGYYSPLLRDSIVKNFPTTGGTIHQAWIPASSLTMVPDCNGQIVSPIWEVVGVWKTNP